MSWWRRFRTAVGIKRRMELAKLLAPELRPETENLLRLL